MSLLKAMVFKLWSWMDTHKAEYLAHIADVSAHHTDHQAAQAESAQFKDVNIPVGEAYKQNNVEILSTKNYVTKVGVNAGKSLTSGVENTFVGRDAGEAVTTGSYSLYVGLSCGKNTTSGDYNMFVGMSAGYYNTTGHRNVFFGHATGYKNVGGARNTAIGIGSLYSNVSGDYNVAIGFAAGHSSPGSNNVFIGRGAGYSEAGSDKLYINNTSAAIPLIWGDFTNNKVGIRLKPAVSKFGVAGIPTYATDAAAGTAGLTSGEFYKHADGSLHVKL